LPAALIAEEAEELLAEVLDGNLDWQMREFLRQQSIRAGEYGWSGPGTLDQVLIRSPGVLKIAQAGNPERRTGEIGSGYRTI